MPLLCATQKLLISPMLMRGRASRSPSSVNRPGAAAEQDDGGRRGDSVASDHLPSPPCHFARSEGTWRNLSPQRYAPLWGGRSLDAEFQQRPDVFALTPARCPAGDDIAAGCIIVMPKRKKPEIISNGSTGRKAPWRLMFDVSSAFLLTGIS